MTAMDIRSTLSNVCRRVLHDTSVDQTVLLKRFVTLTQIFPLKPFSNLSFTFLLTVRCHALKILGLTFVAHGVSSFPHTYILYGSSFLE